MANIEKPTGGLDIDNILPSENIIITNEIGETTDSYKELMLIKNSDLSNFDLDKFRYIVTFLEKNYPNYTTTNPKIGYLVGFILDKIISSKDARSSARREYIEKNLPEIAAKISSLRVEVGKDIDKRITVEYNENETIEQTNNIKNFLKKSILGPEAFLDKKEIDLPNIRALTQKLNAKKDLSPNEKIFFTEVGNLIKRYRNTTENYILQNDSKEEVTRKRGVLSEIESYLNPLEKINEVSFVLGALNDMNLVIQRKEEYKKKSFSGIISEIKDLDKQDNVDSGEKIKIKSILIPALAEKMRENGLYFDTNFKLVSLSMHSKKVTQEDLNSISGISSKDKQVLSVYLGFKEGIVKLNTNENIPNNVFDEVVGQHNFLNSEGKLWNIQRDFEYREGASNTKELSKKNKTEFIIQADKKISELKSDNKGKSDTEIQNNIADIQKLELAKTVAEGREQFSDESLGFIKEALKNPEGTTAILGIPSTGKGSIEDFAKSFENGKIRDEIMNLWPIGILGGAFYALLNWLTKGTVLNKFVDGAAIATLIATAGPVLAKNGMKISDLLPKEDLNGTNKPDRKGDIDEAIENADKDMTNLPNGLDSKYSGTYLKMNRLNKNENQGANFDEKKFDQMFLILSSDYGFLQNDVKEVDLKDKNSLFGSLNSQSKFYFEKYNIKGEDLIKFCNMLNNSQVKGEGDKNYMDVFLEGQEKNNENHESYFLGEDQFNKDIDKLVTRLPGVPLKSEKLGDEEEIKKTSLRAKVQSAIDPDYFSGSGDIRSKFESLKTLNTFDETRLNIIQTINKDLSNIPEPKDANELAILKNIKSKYASLEKKHKLLYDVDKLVFDGGYGHCASILGTGGLIFGDVARNIPINQTKTNNDQAVELKRIIDDIDKLNLPTELTKLVAEGVMTEEDKTSVLREVMKMKERVNENQEASLLILVNSNDNKDKAVNEKQLEQLYLKKMETSNGREKLKKEVQDIVNRLELGSSNIQDTLSFRKALGEYGFTSDIKNDEIKKLKIIMNITKDGKNDEIITLATQGISENFAKFKKDLLDYGTSKKAEIDTIKSNIATITDINKLKEEKDKLDEIRKDFFIGDNSITATAIYGVESLINWTGLGDGKSNKEYNFFKTMEKRVQEIEPTFNIPDTNYPSETVLTDAYNEVNDRFDSTIFSGILTSNATYLSFGSQVDVKNYIDTLKLEQEAFEKYKDICSGSGGKLLGSCTMNIGKLENDFKKEQKSFVVSLKNYLSSVTTFDELKSLESVYQIFNTQSGSEWLGAWPFDKGYLIGTDHGLHEALFKKAVKLKIESGKTIRIKDLPNDFGNIREACLKVIDKFKARPSLSTYFNDTITLEDFVRNLRNLSVGVLPGISSDDKEFAKQELDKINGNLNGNIDVDFRGIGIDSSVNIPIKYLWSPDIEDVETQH